MRKYIATHKTTELRMLFTYDHNGHLISTELVGPWKIDQIEWFYTKFSIPIMINKMWEYCENGKSQWTFIEQPTDLSFKSFYDLYGYKKGGPLKAQELWQKLPDDEKLEVLLFIPKYKSQKQVEGTALKYPEFFLRNKPWLAEKI